MPNTRIAVEAQKPPDLSGGVIMINMKSLSAYSTADSTPMILFCCHAIIIIKRYTMSANDLNPTL
jgi:hypothetical protein